MIDPSKELLDRTRRIETRVTQLCIAAGVHTGAQRPEFVPDTDKLLLPSPHSSLKEISDAVPPGIKSVSLFLGGAFLGTFHPA